MLDVIEELKHAARILHRRVAAGDPAAIARVRAHLDGPPHAAEPDEADRGADVVRRARRRHALAAIAAELGFDGWAHLTAVLRGDASRGFGKTWFLGPVGAHWNIWSSSYAEARRIRDETGGFLLGFQRQYAVVDEHFVRSAGLDPADPDWERIDRDWVRPRQPLARERLYGRLFATRLDELRESVGRAGTPTTP